MKLKSALIPLFVLSVSTAQATPEITPRQTESEVLHPLSDPVEHISPDPGIVSPHPRPHADLETVLPQANPVQILQRPTAVERMQQGMIPIAEDAVESPLLRTIEEMQRQTEEMQRQAELVEYNRIVQRGIVAFNSGNYLESAQILSSIWSQIQAYADMGMMLMLGYAAMNTNQETLSLQAMREATTLVDEDEFRTALIDALIHFRRFDQAAAEIQQITDAAERQQRQRDLNVLRGWRAYEEGHYQMVVDWLNPYQDSLTDEELHLLSLARERMSTPTPRQQRQVKQPSRYERTLQMALRAFERDDYPASVELLVSVWPQMRQQGETGMMVMLGYAAMHSDQEDLAITAMREAATRSKDNAHYLSLSEVLIHFNRLEEAETTIAKMTASPQRDRQRATLAMIRSEQAYQSGDYALARDLLVPHHAILPVDGRVLLGWVFYQLDDMATAVQHFESAYRENPSEAAAQGLVFSLHQLNDYNRLLRIVDDISGSLNELLDDDARTLIASGHRRFTVDADARLTAVTQLADGDAPGFSVRLAPNIRQQHGTRGENRLSQSGLTLSGQWRGHRQSLTVELEQQQADNHHQKLSGQRAYLVWQQRIANGLETHLGLGQTLSGGTVNPALIGEIGLSYYELAWGMRLRAFRRGNQESLLALAGQRDPDTQISWGRVLETGAQLDGNLSLASWDMIASVTASQLTGQRVADNQKLEFYGQALHPVPQITGLRFGPELYATAFERNLSAFEPGHGGYFSPSSFTKVGIMADYNTQLMNHLEINTRAGIGWGWNRQAAADGNPLTGEGSGKYVASQDNGINYHGQLDLIWNVRPQWQLGFSVGGQQSPEYTNWQTGLFIQRHK